MAFFILAAAPSFARDWFVDNSAAAAGDGSAAAPLQSLRAVQEASGPGDAILLRPGARPYSDGIVLQEGQTLTGSGGRPIIAPTNTDAIVLAARTTISGVAIRANTRAAIRGRAIGDVVIRDVTIETSGDADGLVLVETRGNVTFETGALSGSGDGTALVFDGGSAPISVSNVPVTQKRGAALAVRNRAGAVTLGKGTSLTVSEGKRDAIVLTANRGAIVIAEAMRIVTEGAAALIVRDSDSVTLASADSVLTTRGAQGVHVANSGVAADVRAISVDGVSSAVDHGVVLENMRGHFRVHGHEKSSGSGGTLRNIRRRGIVIDRAANVTLRRMVFERASTANGTNCGRPAASGEHLRCNGAIHLKEAENIELDALRLSGSAQNGILGDSVRDFALTNSEITAAGDEVDEAGLLLRNATGNVRIAATTFRESATRQVEIVNDGGEAAIDVQRSTIGKSREATGQQGMLINAGGDARVRLAVTDSTIADNFSTALHVIAAGTATVDVTVTGNKLRDNGSALVFMPTDAAKLSYRIEGNTISGTSTSAVTITSTSREGASGTILRNVFGISGKAGSGSTCGGGCSGVAITANGRGTSSAVIANNTIQQVDSAIRVRAGDTATLNVRITGNTLREPSATARPAVVVQAGARPKDTGRICADVGGGGELANIVSGGWNASQGGAAIQFIHKFAGTMSIAGYAGAPTAYANAAKFVAGRNRGAAVAADITTPLTLADHCIAARK